MQFKYGTELRTDPIEDFRNTFYKNVENEKLQKDQELKLKQKNCWHKYTKFLQYNEKYTIGVCERCNHAKWC